VLKTSVTQNAPANFGKRAAMVYVVREVEDFKVSVSTDGKVSASMVLRTWQKLRLQKGDIHMDVKATLQPGQNGTKLLLEQYGDQLVCVRYRYDKSKRKSYKTVELIVEEKDWIPNTIVKPFQTVSIRIGYNETRLRDLVKDAGGYWDIEKKVWKLPYRMVHDLGLEKRITDDSLGF